MITPDGSQADTASPFRRSSFCGAGGCVEVALRHDGVALRDGKDDDPGAPVLRFDAQEWDAFLRGVLAGEFSRDALAGAPVGTA